MQAVPPVPPRPPGPMALPGAHGAPLALLALFNSHRDLCDPLQGLGHALLHGGVLDPRERELLIMRVAAVAGVPYIEAGHRPIAAIAGLEPAELAAIADRSGEGSHELDERQRRLLAACDQLVETGDLTPSVRAQMTAGRDPRELVEAVIMVGFYAIIASLAKVYDLRPETTPPAGVPERRSAAAQEGR